MEFRVLGPLQATVDDRALPLGGYRQRLVLAALLLDPGRPVSADRLIDIVWGDDPPRTARKTLQAYVSRLRGVLGDGVLEASSGGYRLRAAPEAG